MPQLTEYNRKRNFKITSEPRGKAASQASGDYMIHLHDARRLHYDLRLGWKGVLKCWAVPKGPSLNPKDKRLAIMTEDHPMDYKNFEGIIPDKQYGAGPSLIWDAGRWRPLEDFEAGLKKGSLRIFIQGIKLKGVWKLIKMKFGGSKSQWLMIKENDKYSSKDLHPEKWEESVLTGKTLSELEERPHESSKKAKATRKPSKPKRFRTKELVKEAFPKDFSLKPQLAVRTNAMPEFPNRLIERKYDGYRLLTYVHKGKVSLITRNGKDWTKKLSHICESLAALDDGVYDGELVYVDSQGLNSFNQLQNALDKPSKDLALIVFDILHYQGVSTRALPLLKRRELLESIFDNTQLPSQIQLSPLLHQENVFEHACQEKWEGLIVKDGSEPYCETRHGSWLKVKCGNDEEFVIIGYTDPKGQRKHLGALLIADFIDGRLVYRGKVGTGFNTAVLKSLLLKLKHIEQSQPPEVEGLKIKKAHWVKPKYYAQTEFYEMTGDGRLRHPVYKGLRLDKSFKPEEPEVSSAASLEPVITSPERIIFEDVKVSKRDLAEYYVSIMPHFLARSMGYPLSLVRCPQGASHQCFFQKHLGSLKIESLPTICVQEKKKTDEYSYITAPEDVLNLVQFGTLEFHAWNSQVTDLERPLFIVMDLDPDKALEFSKVTEAAHFIKLLLKEFKLSSFVRTTGGKGLHVVASIKNLDWEQAYDFSKMIAETAVSAQPSKFTSTLSKSKRSKKIFIDYLRNQRGSTSILNYSLRTKPGALIATPLDWTEVNEDLNPKAFDIKSIPERLARQKQDPWKDFIIES